MDMKNARARIARVRVDLRADTTAAPSVSRQSGLALMTGVSALALAVATGGIMLPRSASAQTTTWQGTTSTDWYDPANWNNGVPNGGVHVEINTNMPRAAIIDGGIAAAVNVFIGEGGGGELTVTNGARIDNSGANIGGSTVAGSGLLTITGPGTHWAGNGFSRIGNLGQGNVVVSNGGRFKDDGAFLGMNPGVLGAVTVTGAGSTWQTGNVQVGSSGNGTVTVSDGGSVTSSSTLNIGTNGGNGTVSLTGSTSSWIVSSGMNIGGTGGGTLTVSGGALMRATSTTNMGNDVGAVGFATVTGSGSRLELQNLNVGNVSQGTLTVSNGGSASSGLVTIGLFGGSVGTATVTGTGSLWRTTRLDVGYTGTGTLTVSGAGTFEHTAPLAITLGYNATGNGTLNVTGANSSFSALTSVFTIGRSGQGTMTISDGGTVSTLSGVIGNTAAASVGTVTVTGTGSNWTTTNSVTIGNSGTGTLTIADGGRVTAPNGVTIAINATAQGTLNLRGSAVAGRGVLETNRVDTFAGTGRVEFDGGMLRLTANEPDLFFGFAPGQVVLAGGGGFIDTQAFDVGTPLGLAGPGGLTKLGSGTLTLTGANTFLGGLAVNGGTLAFETEANLGAVAGGITIDGGTLRDISAGATTVNHAITIGAGGATLASTGIGTVYRGVIGGAGNLIVDAAGSIVLLEAANSYGGTTTVAQGTLAIIGGAAIPDASTVSVAAGATLEMRQTETIGALTGAGEVTNPVPYIPLTLTVGGGDGSGTFSGVLRDANANAVFNVTKTGAGTQVLSGVNTYSGVTTVNAGILTVNGSIANSSSVAITNGGTLNGTGTLGPTAVHVGGTLAPGNSIGTLTVNGSLAFGPGSIYAVEVSPTDADRTNVVAVGGTGEASLLGGTVAASYQVVGGYVAKQYTIVSAAGGLGGTTFAGLTGAAPTGFTHQLAYDGSNAYLALTLLVDPRPPTKPDTPDKPDPDKPDPDKPDPDTPTVPIDKPVPKNPVSYDSLNVNQRSVADTVVSFFNANGYLPAVLAPSQAFDLTLMSGEIATAAVSAGFDTSDRFLQTIGDPSLGGVAFPEQGSRGDASAWRMWGSAQGSGGKIEGDGVVIGSADLSSRAWGLASGFTSDFDNGRFGVALGGAGSSFELANGLGSGNTTSFNAGLHGRADFGDSYVSGALAYGYHATRTSRSAFGDTLTADYGAHTFGGRVEAGHDVHRGAAILTPYAAVQALSYRMPGHTETSALSGALALSYAGQSETSVHTELGARFAYDLSAGMKLTGRAAWQWNASAGRTVSAGFSTLPGTIFTIDGARPDRHAALLDLGLDAALAENVTASFSLTGAFSQNVTSYGARGRIGFTW